MVVEQADEGQGATLKEQLGRLYNTQSPEQSVIVGCTTNPPLSVNAISRMEGSQRIWGPDWVQWIDGLIDGRPYATRYQLFWETYMRVVELGAKVHIPTFKLSGFTQGFLSGQVEPRFLRDTAAMVARACRRAGFRRGSRSMDPC